MKLAAVITGAVLTLAAVTGCSLSASTSTSAGAVQSTGPGTFPVNAGVAGAQPQLINPASVKVTACHLGESFGHLAVKFQGEVTNTTMLTRTISVEVWFYDRNGELIDSDYPVADNVLPGQTAHLDGGVLTEKGVFPGGKVTCDVKSVELSGPRS